eukprot:scaffold191142_cov30-Prasinocladus_malaysianus.AAC.1
MLVVASYGTVPYMLGPRYGTFDGSRLQSCGSRQPPDNSPKLQGGDLGRLPHAKVETRNVMSVASRTDYTSGG